MIDKVIESNKSLKIFRRSETKKKEKIKLKYKNGNVNNNREEIVKRTGKVLQRYVWTKTVNLAVEKENKAKDKRIININFEELSDIDIDEIAQALKQTKKER